MKKVVIFLMCFNLFSREFNNLKINGMGFDFDMDYLSIPNTFDLSLYYVLNDSKISPFIGLGSDYHKTILFVSGFKYFFRNFSSKIFYEIRTPFNLNKKYIEHEGNFLFGYNFDYFKFENSFTIGLINNLLAVDNVENIYFNTLTLKNKISLLVPIYYSEFQRMDTKVIFVYRYLFGNEDQVYNVHWNFKYLLSLPFGELGFKVDFLKSDSLFETDLETRVDYHALNLYPLAFPLFDDPNSIFNTIFNFGFEYRVFFLEYLRNAVSDLFLLISFDVGYGFDDVFIDNGKFLYIVSFGIGYKLFREIPFVFKVGINQDKQFMLGFIVSSINFDN
ncbi:hypothetical protein [Borreliella afzelii]|uniref:hypothetical protein n=1 Tax=Borreliella afzelii TaxID=29518 RepID=UPI00061A19D7|nr:hypothetical protein BAFK78_AC017 [Borreliella afzelii K78]